MFNNKLKKLFALVLGVIAACLYYKGLGINFTEMSSGGIFLAFISIAIIAYAFFILIAFLIKKIKTQNYDN